ncbi:TBPIP-domain-containing protein [Auriscalpium vulgare]|uniref:TBPIP-domain-containing protein n=1 Tax=Auriscalpium vulgare TaxID=40419 RepID=A0ACB8R6Y1_9AGAM|nr:TBPIP-domain-containing protein [Auriscalpium vulgare]
MPPKEKSDVKVLKGQDAEDCILDYITRMNRPFGAVDVSANLKGAVPKAATQKILIALAEKGAVTQKTYGKTTFFVTNQANAPALPDSEIKALTTELAGIEETNKALAAEVKTLSTELAKIKATPTNESLASQISDAETKATALSSHLTPLRNGTPLISAADLALLDTDWLKLRAEWVRRKKVFLNFWALVADSLSPQDAVALAEDLGIEHDTPEHAVLERSTLCVPSGKRR